ncbi:MAG: thiamine phosphate synthase [Acidaminococcaceae bacterium]|nr:thiamine phosphate synthase [Acidaminococcaceae bacterium]
MKNFNLRLYLVTDENCLPPGRNLFDAVEEALQAGVTLVQYREKNGLGKGMLEKARKLIVLCHKYNVPLLVNDRLDIALLSGADGVHLGQDDIPVAEARRMVDLFFANSAATQRANSPASCIPVNDNVSTTAQQSNITNKLTGNSFIIGATAHNVQEALAAQAAGADYLGCGAVFATSTKKDTVPLGLDGLKAIRQAVHIPITGIAGITPDNYQQVLATGADGVAVVSAILGAVSVRGAVNRFFGCK